MTIKIAVAGHTNTGKTTFITTLMRMKVGKIDDSANVTTKGEFHYYDGLQATFIDTPGFQHSGLAFTFLKGTGLDQEDMESIEYDLEAIEVIKKSDIAIYLGDLNFVPDNSHIKEIKVVKKIQPKVVAVLNQYHQTLEGGGKQKVDNHIRQWTGVLNENGIDDVIIFDAHWDKRSKEQEIYDALEKNLDHSQKLDFREGLNKFKKRQSEIREEICQVLARTLQQLQQIRVVDVKKEEYNAASKEEYQKKVERSLRQEILGFIAYTSSLYEVAAEYPTEATEDLILKTNQKISFSGRLGTITGVSMVFGTIGAVFGGVVGGLITGVLSGGSATIPGAIEGAKIFGTLGVALGSFFVFDDSGDRIDIFLKSEKIEDIVKELLAIVWGLDHNGFGRGRSLSREEVEKIKIQIDALFAQQNFAQQNIDDWTKVNQVNVINFCQNLLDELENN
jgi:signal recognition particle receptor subunit beta